MNLIIRIKYGCLWVLTHAGRSHLVDAFTYSSDLIKGSYIFNP